MLNKLLRKRSSGEAGSSSPFERHRVADGSTAADLAAEMLCAPNALMHLTLDEARTVVSFMQPKRFAEGTTFIREGDTRNTGFMVLVLDGEVTIESIAVSRVSPVTVTVLGPGALIGEMGLVDGEPRTASCTASTDLRCAVLTREALEELIDEDPRTGAKLMFAIATRIAERFRDSADKLKLYTQLVQAMQDEINKS